MVPKLTLSIAGIGGVSSAGVFVAYKTGLFSSKEESLTVKSKLAKEGYELANNDEQFKTFFKEFKSDTVFMNEVDRYKKEGEDLKNDNEGDLGKLALKALCSSYFESKDNLSNAVKWCVLRIQDKPLTSGSWISDAGGNDNEEWKSTFDKSKAEMADQGIKGITVEMDSTQGHSKIKDWCLENKKLPINTRNKIIQNNVISWCSKQE